MSLQNDFLAIITSAIKNCDYYRHSFNGKKKRNTIEGAFGYHIVDKVFNYLKGLLKPTRKTVKTINKRLQNCFDLLTALAVKFDRLDRAYWAKYLRDIANQLLRLLPQQFVQLVLFDDADYIIKEYDGKGYVAISEKPMFDCFKQWLSAFKDRQFQQNLQRYLYDPNFSYDCDNSSMKLRIYQPSIPKLIISVL